jgi:hypothetical protein
LTRATTVSISGEPSAPQKARPADRGDRRKGGAPGHRQRIVDLRRVAAQHGPGHDPLHVL